MRSNFSKETSNMNKSKSKKVMEYVHLLSTNEDDKVKKIDKKSQLNKNHIESKTNLNKQLCSNRFNIDKEKFSLNLNHEVKKHARSKTQYFKPLTQNTYHDDIFQDQPIISKYDIKKRAMKKDQSQKRLKTQSSKRLQSSSQSKSNLHQIKSKFKQQATKNISTSAKSSKPNQKSTTKHYKKPQQTEKKYISSINQNLHILREKLKREKSNYSSKDKNSKNSKKINNKFQDSKNMTFLNLSQILQRNDCDEEVFVDKKNRASARDIKSDRSMKNATTNPKAQKLKQIFSNLQQRVQYMTWSISESVTKQKRAMKIEQGKKQKMDGKSFSFVENPIINAKLGKSNFSTGQGSVGPDYEFQQLLKLKFATQLEVNKQISKDLSLIREIYQYNQQDSRPKTARVYETEMSGKEKSSARTYQRYETDEKQLKLSNMRQKQMLLNFLTKYHEMTTEILPLLLETKLKESNQDINPQIGQKKMKRDSEEMKEENRKYIKKYNAIMQKNFKYQHVINSLIRDGVNVQKYMQGFLNAKV